MICHADERECESPVQLQCVSFMPIPTTKNHEKAVQYPLQQVCGSPAVENVCADAAHAVPTQESRARFLANWVLVACSAEVSFLHLALVNTTAWDIATIRKEKNHEPQLR